jgi:RES domain-containing protein
VDVATVGVDGVWWRQVPHAADPLFRADPPSDGRWQRGETVGALYFADSEETAWAEWYRALAEFAIPPDRQMPRDLWRWDVEVDDVADLSTAERMAALDLSQPRPTRRQWAPFQAVGERLWREGHRGVLAPSAARPTGQILCAFRGTDELDGITPVRPPTTYRHPPAPPTGMTT